MIHFYVSSVKTPYIEDWLASAVSTDVDTAIKIAKKDLAERLRDAGKDEKMIEETLKNKTSHCGGWRYDFQVVRGFEP